MGILSESRKDELVEGESWEPRRVRSRFLAVDEMSSGDLGMDVSQS